MIGKNMLKKAITLSITLSVTTLTGCWQSPTSNSRTESNEVTNYKPTERVNSNSNTGSNVNTNSTMAEDRTSNDKTGFTANLPSGFSAPKNDVEKKLLTEYGAVFVARGGAKAPEKIVFLDQADVTKFQSSLSTSRINIGGHDLELQTAAMDGLRKAIDQAKGKGLSITPRGADSAKRTYDETVGLWKSRVDPALKHWVSNGKLSQADADKLRSLSTFDQVIEVLKLEEKGIYFAKDLSKSIIYSVAPPGTSQHLSMLALDVTQFEDSEVRKILAENGWFQTVVSDLPHFTFLGVKESELPGLGLKKITQGGRIFWVPEI